jgi:hypothetical protein
LDVFRLRHGTCLSHSSVTRTLSQSRRIELLLNELRYERHVRRALLWELVDELDEALPHVKSAATAARGLLILVEAEIGGDDFASELDRIAVLAGVEKPAQAMAG